MNDRNTSILYIAMFIGLVIMLGGSLQNFLDSEEEIIVHAKEVTEVTIPTATPTPEPPTIEEMIIDTFGDEADTALAIAKCESRLNPEAVNDNTSWGGIGRDHGIFQINDVFHSDKYRRVSDLYDAEFNIEVAKKIYDSSGWYAWTCYKNGYYKEHLN